MPGPIVAVVLAAGGGTRYAGPTSKLLAPLPGGATVVGRAVAAAVDAAVGPVLVVTGAADLAAHLPPGVEAVANPRWAEGQATSLATALAWAGDRGAEAVVVGLGDQPGLDPSAWRAVAATASPLAIATYAGRRGHPVRLGAAVWLELPASGDEGARAVLRAHPDDVVEVPCAGDPADVDTVADLARWSGP